MANENFRRKTRVFEEQDWLSEAARFLSFRDKEIVFRRKDSSSWLLNAVGSRPFTLHAARRNFLAGRRKSSD
jgi:hypothetical protein